MNVDLLIRDCRLVSDSIIEGISVGIDEGKISFIATSDNSINADRTINANGKILLPGMIDAHVHFRDPGYEYKEDFQSGSRAAASGGVTTVFDMPNTLPLVESVSVLLEKINIAQRKSIVNFGLFGLLSNKSVGNLADLHRKGAIGFKAYLSESQLVKTENSPPSDYSLYKAFKITAKLEAIVAIHAENNSILEGLKDEAKKEGRKDVMSYLASRPSLAEEEAITRASIISRELGGRLHVCHVSSALGARAVKTAKDSGTRISAETCPHYLFMDVQKANSLGSIIKQTPPVRSIEDSEALFRSLKSNVIDIIASDHSPHLKEEKLKENVWDALGGFPGVETMLPLLMTEVNRGRLSLLEVVEKTAEHPAKVFGLSARKGRIAVGLDADLVLVDMKKTKKIIGDNLQSKSKVTPFEGVEVQGLPICTVVNGHVVMYESDINEDAKGRFVRPQPLNES